MPSRKEFVEESTAFAQFILAQAEKRNLSFGQLGAATSSILIGLMRQMELEEKTTVLNGLADLAGVTPISKSPAGIA